MGATESNEGASTHWIGGGVSVTEIPTLVRGERSWQFMITRSSATGKTAQVLAAARHISRKDMANLARGFITLES